MAVFYIRMNLELQKPTRSELFSESEKGIQLLDRLKIGMIVYGSRPSTNSNPFYDIKRIIGFSTHNGYCSIIYEYPEDSSFEKWIRYGIYSNTKEKYNLHMSVSSIIEHKYKVCEYEEFMDMMEESKKIIENPSLIDMYSVETFNDETALVGKINSSVLEVIKEEAIQMSEKASAIKNMVEWHMEMYRAQLRRTMDAMSEKIALILKEADKINRVITIIKLYLGIEETLIQLKSGDRAHGKVTFRQSVIFMDEEYMAWENGGLNWEDIKLFDEWLLKNDNYKKIIPEDKGMVAMKPRRYDLDYRYYGFHYTDEDKKRDKYMTYFLIRNGENLYRIYTNNLALPDHKLFPSQSELLELSELEPGEKESDDKMYAFRKQAMFMQGLFDRTEVFNPIGRVSVTDPDSIQNNISYIYDSDENLLSDGSLTWRKKLSQCSKIKPGDRVIFIGLHNSGLRKDNIDRYVGNYSNEWSVPAMPQEGLYLVHEYKPTFSEKMSEQRYEIDYRDRVANGTLRVLSKKPFRGERFIYTFEKAPKLVIKYNPEDTVYGSWGSYDSGHKRKNNVSFIIEERDYVYQFDEISAEECYHFLHNRPDRRNYLRMMPVLHQIIKIKKQEEEVELEFAKMIVSSCGLEVNEKSIEVVMGLIQWWKLKNKWKRPLSKDDEKAYRMIVSKLKSQKK